MNQKNLDIYGNQPIPWSRALEQLEAPQGTRGWWLATTRPDGRPHLAGVGALWVDGKVYVVSGPGTRKSRNLSENPHCSISTSLPGLDLVIEGTAADRRPGASTPSRLSRPSVWPRPSHTEPPAGGLTRPNRPGTWRWRYR